jgi:ureidoacrylate peracid hydrolase
MEETYDLLALLREPTALLVIDMQNDFVHDEGAFSHAGFDVGPYQALIPQILNLRKAAKEKDISTWIVGMSHNATNDGNDAWIKRRRGKGHPDTCRTGTWGQGFYTDMEPAVDDKVMLKHRYSAFVGTDLHERLQEEQLNTLVICGINTNTCVESTARDAHMLGYHVIVIRDATACAYTDAYVPSLHNIERHFGLVAQTNDIVHIWKG